MVEVHSARDGERNALRIDVDDLRAKIAENKPYHPDPIKPTDDLGKHGTIIRLSSLKRQRLDMAIAGLRKRVARRFDVLSLTVPGDDKTPPLVRIQTLIRDARNRLEGELSAEERTEVQGELQNTFYVTINGDPIGFHDRVELKKLEYIWEFGGEVVPAENLADDVKRTVIPDTVPGDSTWKVTGWFGTVAKPDQARRGQGGGLAQEHHHSVARPADPGRHH
ncbi:hypothetical protein G5V59_20145 [Nocardioides sp. W3-2-3]|uniref:hypothetical protein n=1 Tax=Nocardioides convexus TaxID=2712224 RepID=UPI0024187E2E|nr:hypothetical protein [Nocardioides convexus]NHA01373.1 hypothetical protein [Nocardioides convexus]